MQYEENQNMYNYNSIEILQRFFVDVVGKKTHRDFRNDSAMLFEPEIPLDITTSSSFIINYNNFIKITSHLLTKAT